MHISKSYECSDRASTCFSYVQDGQIFKLALRTFYMPFVRLTHRGGEQEKKERKKMIRAREKSGSHRTSLVWHHGRDKVRNVLHYMCRLTWFQIITPWGVDDTRYTPRYCPCRMRRLALIPDRYLPAHTKLTTSCRLCMLRRCTRADV